MAGIFLEPPRTQETLCETNINPIPTPVNLQPTMKKRERQGAAKPKTRKAPAIANAPKKPKIVKEPKPKTDKVKKPRVHHKSEHPAWSKMMCAAITALNEKQGSSIPAIKKYILANFKGVDEEHFSVHLRRGMKAALASGSVKQVKGQGLSGSFKLGAGKKNTGDAKKVKKTVKKTKTGTKNQCQKSKKRAAAGAKKTSKKVKAKVAGARKAKPIKVKTAKSPKSAKAPKPKTHKK